MVNRLFQIVYMLMDKSYMTAKELAERLEVSERTIYRDLDKLSLAGVPVYTNRGKGGGISLLSDYILDKAVLTSSEREQILESLQTLSAVGFDDEGQALDKLRTFFGNDREDWIEVEFLSWGDEEAREEQFRQLKHAILHYIYVDMEYSAADEHTTKRRVKPLKLCFREQAWYLYAYCEMRQDYRFFKLRRIRHMELLEIHFDPINVGKVLVNDDSKQKSYPPPVRVSILISKEMAYRAYDELTHITVTETGDLLCEIDVVDMEWLLGYVFSYGTAARIVGPADVRQLVQQTIMNIGKLYN